MTLQQLEKLVNAHGLVPMKITTEAFAPYFEGDIAGFFPDTALDLIGKGAAVPIDKDGEPIEITPEASALPAGGGDAPTVEIPEAWASLHHLQRVKLAKAIAGRTDITKVEDADAIITAEVERRAAAVQPAAD